MKHYDRLIFVSNSDTCRAPMAQAILKSKYLLGDLEIHSRGLVVLFPEPVNQKGEAVLASHGLSMKEHAAKALVKTDLEERTLILTMDEDENRKISQNFEDTTNVYLLSSYVGSMGEVKTPMGGTLADYGACYEQLDNYITKLVVLLNEEELLC